MSRRGPAAGFALLLALTVAAVAVPVLTQPGATTDRWPTSHALLPARLGPAETCRRLAPNRVDARIDIELQFSKEPFPFRDTYPGVFQDEYAVALTVRNVSDRGVPTVRQLDVLVLRPGTDEVVGGIGNPWSFKDVPPLAPGTEAARGLSLGLRGCQGFLLRNLPNGTEAGLWTTLPAGDYEALPIGLIVQNNAEAVYASVIGRRTRFTVERPIVTARPSSQPCQPGEAALGLTTVAPPVPTPLASPYPEEVLLPATGVKLGIVPLQLQDRPCRLRTEAVLRLPCRPTSTDEHRSTVEVELPAGHLRVLRAVPLPPGCDPFSDRRIQVLHTGGLVAEFPRPVAHPLPG